MTKPNSTPSEAYAWIATWNNPEHHCDDLKGFNYLTAAPEQFIELQLKIVDMFVHASPRARKPETSSIIVACEAGSTFHCHMLFAAKRKIPFKSLQSIYPGIHLEPARGTWEQCSDYLHKIGTETNLSKAETKLCEPMIWGEFRFTPKDQAPRQSIFDRINALLDKGYTPNQLYEMDAKLAYYANAIERTFLARTRSSIPVERNITVYYHTGPSQQGKSHTYFGLVEKYGQDAIHLVGEDRNWPFQMYTNQRILFIDEFRDTDIPYSTLLRYLSKLPLILRVKNSSAYAAWDEVHITSVIPPERLYQGERHSSYDTLDQLHNRITYVVYHWKDENGYHQFQLPMEAYENYDQIEYLATGKCSNPFAKMSNLYASAPEAIQPPKPTQAVQPSAESEAPPSKASEDTDFDLYSKWELEYLPLMAIEPEPAAITQNPFIQCEFSPGLFTSNEFNTLAFLDAMNKS